MRRRGASITACPCFERPGYTILGCFCFAAQYFKLAPDPAIPLSESYERAPRQHPGMDRLRTLGGAQEDRGGCLRLRARARRDHRLSRSAFVGPLLLCAEG